MTDNQKELVNNMFDTWQYRKGSYIELSYKGYYHKPEDLYKLEEINAADKSAVSDIAALQAKIEMLKAYRVALFDRYQEVNSVNTKKLVRLERYKGYSSGGKVIFYLRVFDVFPDGQKIETHYERYTGKERKAAISAYEAYIKSHPGIEAEKDIEKGPWER